MFLCLLCGHGGQWSGYSQSASIIKHKNHYLSTKESGQMIAVGMTCNERRGGGGGDKVNRMTEEAIAPEKNQYTWTMFVLIAISH